jgi:hypothetical protein
MMASLQQAINKGMPPDQAIQYVKSMATQGVAPLADLYSMMNQFQRLKQQQVKPPQTPPTIRDQLNMMNQMQQMQASAPPPQAMDRGLGSINAGRMENPQFAGGGVVALQSGGFLSDSLQSLGEAFGAQSMAAPVNPMGREVSLANISLEDIAPQFEKALAEGDQERANALSAALNRTERGRALEANIRNKVVQARRAQEAQARQQGALSFVRGEKPPAAPGAGAGTAPPAGTGGQKPPGVPGLGGNYDTFGKYRTEAGKLRTTAEGEANLTAMQRAQQIEKDMAAMGVGESAKRRGEYLTKREAEADKDLASDKRMALAQAGFAMAEAASRRGRERTGFLGAAAIGGTTGTKLYQAALKENRAIKDKIQENRFALEQAQEMMKVGNYKEGAAQAREARQNLASLNQSLATNELGISQFVAGQTAQDRRLGAQLAADEKRYAQAAQIAQKKLMQGVLEQAPYLIKDFNKLSREEQAKAVQGLLAGFAGGTGAMTGLDAEIVGEE